MDEMSSLIALINVKFTIIFMYREMDRLAIIRRN